MSKKIFIYFLLSLFFLNCSARKKASQLSNNGNFSEAIAVLVKKLSGGVSDKSKASYYALLHSSYNKLVSQSQERIDFLKKDSSVAKYEEIFTLYLGLQKAQQAIKPLLSIATNDRILDFNMQNYSDDIITSKKDLVGFLYLNALKNLSSNNKAILRKTYDDLIYLNQLQPEYKNVVKLIDEARFKGTDFVYISLENNTQVAIPKRLEDELLQFSSYGLDDKWTVYHSKKKYDLSYDYQIRFNFLNLQVTPERVERNRLFKERVIIDGTEFAVNQNGEQIRDSNGKLIKIDKKVTIRCEVDELLQMKDATIGAKVEFWNERTNQLVDAFPLESNFSFRDLSARVNGDQRALDEDYYPTIKSPVPFPTNEQLIYQGGQNLKNKLKNILASRR